MSATSIDSSSGYRLCLSIKPPFVIRYRPYRYRFRLLRGLGKTGETPAGRWILSLIRGSFQTISLACLRYCMNNSKRTTTTTTTTTTTYSTKKLDSAPQTSPFTLRIPSTQ
ncbi:uncharacterized protein PV06_04258 [Exophiala oligosperma]|uniref:Uncharacterized protein n=1 Tax=Exophiala oligosperma TaxID=215243 RepID=A0A0D2E5N3_9EURO|nr:uncharacterized protein PV06_04258 [Exophiala oligosperma]KIW43114.1 hypothetical protein PV06_04258 [Exophiala oligosperma]